MIHVPKDLPFSIFRYYPDYYEEIKKPLSIINVQKKLKVSENDHVTLKELFN